MDSLGRHPDILFTELSTSTFLPYFVRFLKENKKLQKYMGFFSIFLFFLFFFFNTGSEIYTHYLCYESMVRVFE